MEAARKTRRAHAQFMSVPYQTPTRTWAGRGSGKLCDLCQQPIEADQIEYEVELPAGACVAVLNMHLGCYEEWTTSAPRSL
jgi:hypothetical protein